MNYSFSSFSSSIFFLFLLSNPIQYSFGTAEEEEEDGEREDGIFAKDSPLVPNCLFPFSFSIANCAKNSERVSSNRVVIRTREISLSSWVLLPWKSFVVAALCKTVPLWKRSARKPSSSSQLLFLLLPKVVIWPGIGGTRSGNEWKGGGREKNSPEWKLDKLR